MADIELVIKIPEEVVKNDDYVNYFGIVSKKLIETINNGIPLPKGHGRLIDADNTISKICSSACGCHLKGCGYDKPCYSVTRIESAPTIIEADKEQEDGISRSTL